MENSLTSAPHSTGSGQAKRNLPRDVFLHLLAMVTLYWSAISFITLCWQYVNYWFPDAVNYSYGFSGSIRFAVSSLIIVFPVFLLTSWFLNRIYAKESAVRESKIRKWLIYLTLFIAALVIIGDLIFVINTFLGGEITARFILKALSVIVVATAIFGYYLDDVRKSAASPTAKYAAWASGIIVAIAIVGAFFIVGSPATARRQQFDTEKLNDLQQIEYQVGSYWQRNGKMPAQLADISEFVGDSARFSDPETNQPYEYVLTNATDLTFQLCANFNFQSQPINNPTVTLPKGEVSQNWNHPAGRFCFSRQVNKQMYPPIK